MIWILFIVLIVSVFLILLMFIKQEKMTKNTVLCFTGGLGSGKTYNAVRIAIKFYRKQQFKYKLSRFFLGKRSKVDKPVLYSNIPIKIDKKHNSEVLTREHLLLEADIPEKAIVLIDEVGQVASQYDYENPYVMCELQELIRFYRHYTDGKLILTDQSSANIVVPIRRRINYIYNLNNFRRVWGFLPFFKVDLSCFEVAEEQLTNVNETQTNNEKLLTTEKLEKPYFCGFLPYKWMKGLKHYDSRCYSIRYNHELMDHPQETWEQLKTAYLIDIEASNTERDYYKKYRKHKD